MYVIIIHKRNITFATVKGLMNVEQWKLINVNG